MPQILRPYQSECAESVLDAIADGMKRILYTLPTGAGKTTTFAELTRRALFKNWRVLILAHRTELIGQAYERVKDHCGLREWDIGMEIADSRAHSGNRIIIGSVQTCMRKGRMPDNWHPDIIITDEGHHAAAKKAYGSIYERFDVGGKCIHVACTATAKRSDQQSLYAVEHDGKPVYLQRKGGKPTPADPAESVFEKRVYDYSLFDAIEDGYLVPLRGHAVETDTSLDGIGVTAGDFQKGALEKRVDNLNRTMQAISAWRQIAASRPTIVFCAGVEHAHHAAKLWIEAGYNAVAIDGETDSIERHKAFTDFKAGRVQLLMNCGIYTEGADLPMCSCIVMLRPTRSWTLYMQMAGRASRVLPGIIDHVDTASERRRVVAASLKPDSIIIDLCDLYDKCGDLCSVPSILDLPVKLDLQGHSVTEAKKMLDEFEDIKERVIGECPTTYTELAVKLRDVNLMRKSGAKSEQKWRATDWGYRFGGVSIGYQCDLKKNGEGFWLEVTHRGNMLTRKHGKPGHDMRAYLDAAAKHAQEAIQQHKESLPATSRDTLSRLSPKQIAVLKRNGHSEKNIDALTYGRAKILIGQYLSSYYGRK